MNERILTSRSKIVFFFQITENQINRIQQNYNMIISQNSAIEQRHIQLNGSIGSILIGEQIITNWCKMFVIYNETYRTKK